MIIFISCRRRSLLYCDDVYTTYFGSNTRMFVFWVQDTRARPSEEDLRLLLDPEMIYVIISMMELTSPSIKAFQIKNKETAELSIKVKQGKEA